MAAQMPWPSEPVATSTNGRRGVGCPSRSDSSLAELQQLGAVERAGFSPRGVENRGCVPLGQDEPVAAGVMRILRIEPEFGKEQGGDDVGRRCAARRVAAGRFGGGDARNRYEAWWRCW